MTMGKIGKALCGLGTGLFMAAITFTTNTTNASIIAVSNQMTVISPPPSVVSGTFSNNSVYVFPERIRFTLTTTNRFDISRVGAPVTNLSGLSQLNFFTNKPVDSYYLHHASTATNVITGASVTFDTDILGVFCQSTNIIISHPRLGAPGTLYQTNAGTQGYELGPTVGTDTIAISANRRTLTVSTGTGIISQDDLRVLTTSKPALSPIANAGTNQTVNELDVVTLDGTGSFDPNTPPLTLTYAWTEESGIPVTLTGANTATPTFTAPGVTPMGAALVFRLAVSNGVASGSSSFVTVNVNSVNAPPTANAGADQSVGEASLVTLDGSASSDPDGDLLTLQWSQVSGPTVTLNGSDTVNPTFTAPDVTFAQGASALQFQLVVNDGQVSSGASTVTITVTNINDAPVANAGTNQTVNELATVALDGTASSDPDGNTLSYAWTQILGSPIVPLTGANTATPGFTSPLLNIGGSSGSITLTFQVAVGDGLATNTSTVDVTVNNVNHAPIADAGSDQTVASGATVTLNGTNSADIDGDALTFAWVQTAGTSVTLNDGNTATPSFTAPVTGPSGEQLTFKLTVSDGFGGITNDSIAVNVTYVNHPPTADAGGAQTVNEGDVASLSGTASDPDGNDLTIAWAQMSGPAVTIVNASTLTPSFNTPSVTRDETNVDLRLTADDGFGGITSSDVSIHIANINHAPVAQPPANVTVLEGTTVNLAGQATDADTEEQSQLIYAWTQTSGPTVTLSGADANASFTAPLVTDGGDPNGKVTLAFMLTVTDPNGAAGSNSIEVVVANIDHSPTAVAGNNLTVNEGSSVTLNGSASSDPDLDPLSYSWTQVSGPAVTLSGANTALPYFTAPFVGATGATLQFRLTVDDGFGGTNSAITTVTVNNINTPPNVDNAQPSSASLWPPNHSMVRVSITGVVDPNNNATISITGVTQDEPTNGSGDGDTDVDAVINTDGTVLLRAERAGNGNGRVYHVHFTATDFEGSASGVVKVVVSHNKKNDAVVDGGELYDSTQ